jgi:hypothetical protein
MTRFPRDAGIQFPGWTSGDKRTVKVPSGAIRMFPLEKPDLPVLLGMISPPVVNAERFHHKDGTA